ncbi:hypothetical protein [uncultured Massilia sp.]|uniref:hypothetical protein n=1 Tax=uncultured Massilia sp. TaxID=169973 RepID=UPI0025DF9181|nr:hypothetical protein [uncultured Massilia sp.]
MHFGAAPARAPSRDRLALAGTCAAHLLAALLWMQQRPVAPAPDPARQRAFFAIVLPPAAPAPPRPAARSPATLPATSPPAATSRARPAVRPAVRPAPPGATPPAPVPHPGPVADPAPPPAGAGPGDAAPAADAVAADASATSEPGFALGLARRQAGRIDRELRKGGSGVPTEADTPWGRFRRGVERAHIDRSMMLLVDTYTAPDGVIIYRFRQGNSVRCTRSGSVGVLPSSMAEAGSAGSVPCPRGVAWKPD